ncbi:hypothetical protein GWO43_23210 [candidate division KSB1 bacterium]|nr:hypothetical protein [candidate division KSB1 bacterium]NIR72583.1 hypothetical protein [candidate division KSB1 bacterium]NIS26893.1 hypothetical protein [candidate division KSB1 bacterium]NIT73729.1 hypothetical protein [candidate division KSB1 bacterium]NIU25003.1 hypothetical protein [candidate division KSB1 bacterium]
MTVRYVVLAEEIADELEKLKKVEKKIFKYLSNLEKGSSPKEIYVDSIALSLHSFYTGLENIFRSIATKVDGDLPTGESWHSDLLIQMSTPLKQVRPNVISETILEHLRDLLAFRHRIRNIYSFKINEKQVTRICKDLAAHKKVLFTELNEFVQFLKKTGENS